MSDLLSEQGSLLDVFTPETIDDLEFVRNTIKPLIERNALFVVNHSGGKDSQAMYAVIRELVPDSQIVVMHAELPEADWDGLREHIEDNVVDTTPLLYTRAKKTFWDMVLHRGMFPSPQYRQCTSDLKRGPLEKLIRHYLKDHPDHNGLVVNCTGIRGEESNARAKAQPWKYSKQNSKAGREWYDWLPIHGHLIGDVWKLIEQSGQYRHWAYDEGMSRLSCVFCIMSNKSDLRTAARLRPDQYRRVVMTERKIGHTMMMPRKGMEPQTLDQIVGIPIENLEVEAPSAHVA
ncbi:phosphoadenosine phosphosulfate reductase family protein [Neptuniibacter sp. QD37_11]|uniref:phosphoadenosine phosphosulfate reductase domain-containing protein n=1 Tax=Neptuniibacter sp. QD37_11 TaxID=3398209 RepID=UPI0039F5A4BD